MVISIYGHPNNINKFSIIKMIYNHYVYDMCTHIQNEVMNSKM
jgi:hypothetical protein